MIDTDDLQHHDTKRSPKVRRLLNEPLPWIIRHGIWILLILSLIVAALVWSYVR